MVTYSSLGSPLLGKRVRRRWGGDDATIGMVVGLAPVACERCCEGHWSILVLLDSGELESLQPGDVFLVSQEKG